MIYNFRNCDIDFTAKTVTLMGILNVTPDSFHDGGDSYNDLDKAVSKAKKMVEQGAKIIDIGGESTRPGATPVSEEEELHRVLPVVEKLVSEFGDSVIISVDTMKSKVAAEVLDAGAQIINDVSGLDNDMLNELIAHKCPCYVLTDPGYERPCDYADTDVNPNLLPDMSDRFKKKIELLRNAGIKQIIIDPGFGFNKTLADNYYLLNNLDFFTRLGLPILAGMSHKSMMSKVLPAGAECLSATLVLDAIAVQKGASILRVHDVLEHNNVKTVTETLLKYN